MVEIIFFLIRKSRTWIPVLLFTNREYGQVTQLSLSTSEFPYLQNSDSIYCDRQSPYSISQFRKIQNPTKLKLYLDAL